MQGVTGKNRGFFCRPIPITSNLPNAKSSHIGFCLVVDCAVLLFCFIQICFGCFALNSVVVCFVSIFFFCIVFCGVLWLQLPVVLLVLSLVVVLKLCLLVVLLVVFPSYVASCVC